jgi:thiol-disulfide isomerase/thioredoxin
MKYLATTLLSLTILIATAQKPATPKPAGYEIKVTVKPLRNQFIYLGHYYGKTLPIIDSVKVNERGEGVFRGPKKLGGGIYLIGLPDRSRNFEILVDKSQQFSVSADTNNMAVINFTGSPENNEFRAYQEYMNQNGKEADALFRQRAGSSPADSIRLTGQIEVINSKIRQYRTSIMTREPNALLAVLLKAMKEPEVPQNDPAAKSDTLFAYHYFKKHYWDGVNFTDDRLARTPFFEARIDKYFDQLVYPSSDSVIKEIDWMMSYANVRDEMQKFMLLKFINRYLNQKYMWEDAVFVHLFEKYFAQKTYPWLNDKGKKIITDRAYSLMANIFGSPAADIDLNDTAGKKSTLYSLQAPFVLVTIWDPTCSHCKETLPRLDSIYQAKWKALGLKFYALAKETDGTRKDWMDFIHKNHLGEWTHVYYTKEEDSQRVASGIPSYSQLYDVQSFPTLYLLDKDKRIIAKKVTFDQVDEILDHRIKGQ